VLLAWFTVVVCDLAPIRRDFDEAVIAGDDACIHQHRNADVVTQFKRLQRRALVVE
jgi:hypothetical protein